MLIKINTNILNNNSFSFEILEIQNDFASYLCDRTIQIDLDKKIVTRKGVWTACYISEKFISFCFDSSRTQCIDTSGRNTLIRLQPYSKNLISIFNKSNLSEDTIDIKKYRNNFIKAFQILTEKYKRQDERNIKIKKLSIQD